MHPEQIPKPTLTKSAPAILADKNMSISEEIKFDEVMPNTMQVEEIRLSNASDLADLKTNDPFMFYSIPSVRMNVMEGKEVDLTSIHRGLVKESTKVRRLRRISFESIDNGMSMLMNSLKGNNEQEQEAENDFDSECEDPFDFDELLNAINNGSEQLKYDVVSDTRYPHLKTQLHKTMLV